MYRCWNDPGVFSLHDRTIPIESRLPFFNRELELPTDGQIFEEWVLLANRGDTLAWTGRNEEALADFNRALELRPENAYIYALRGEVLQHLDRPREALTDYDRAIELQADDSDLLSRRSGLHDELGIDT